MMDPQKNNNSGYWEGHQDEPNLWIKCNMRSKTVLCNFLNDVCCSRGNKTIFFLLDVYLSLDSMELYFLALYEGDLFLNKYLSNSLEKIKTRTKDLSRTKLYKDQESNPWPKNKKHRSHLAFHNGWHEHRDCSEKLMIVTYKKTTCSMNVVPWHAARHTIKCDFHVLDSLWSYDWMILYCYFVWTYSVHHVLWCHQNPQSGTAYQHQIVCKIQE
jgi:hypothetical protein